MRTFNAVLKTVHRTVFLQGVPLFVTTKKRNPMDSFFCGDSKGNRTPVTTVKGWCLNRLTMEPQYFFRRNFVL